jgi:uncharacterized protein (TIGR03083 family)
MEPVGPIYTVNLFLPLSRKLLEILKSMSAADWKQPTACSGWTVKDVAAHLLGGNLGRLQVRSSETRSVKSSGMDFDELTRMINRSNAEWVKAARRISPDILIEFLELTDRHLDKLFKNLPLDQPAPITVAWAGNEIPPNWFDIAREYTEKWLHQQHIREAIALPVLMDRKFTFPVFDTFLRALPYTFRNIDALNGTGITVRITGSAGGDWSLVRLGGSWQLFFGNDPLSLCSVEMDQSLAWKLFTKGVSPSQARDLVHLDGDPLLGEKVLQMVSIMA